VAVGKPDPEGYQAAADRLGVPTAATVVLEDAPAGIAAARAAGAGVVVGVGERAAAAGADLVVADLSCLRWTRDGLEAQRTASCGL
jgi:mannitol-1-/sugar-/sorbitol-6-phosphatase